MGLLRNVYLLVTLAAAGLAVRETIAGGPVLTAVLGFGAGVAAVLAVRRRTVAPRVLGFVLFCALAALITHAALDMGGAAGRPRGRAFVRRL